MSPQVAFGEGVSNVPSLMSEFSIHMLGRTDNITLRPHTENMNASSSVPTNRECEKLSMVPLPHGLGKAASICYKRLASLLASKRDQPYSSTIAWLRCRPCFCLLRSSIQCIRGARSACGRASNMSVPQLDLVVSEASISS